MPEDPWVVRSFEDPHLIFRCDCGWTGIDSDIETWDVQQEYNRVVRQCPNCNTAVPEWGTLRPISGVAEIARGTLRQSLNKAGIEIH